MLFSCKFFHAPTLRKVHYFPMYQHDQQENKNFIQTTEDSILKSLLSLVFYSFNCAPRTTNHPRPTPLWNFPMNRRHPFRSTALCACPPPIIQTFVASGPSAGNLKCPGREMCTGAWSKRGIRRPRAQFVLLLNFDVTLRWSLLQWVNRLSESRVAFCYFDFDKTYYIICA